VSKEDAGYLKSYSALRKYVILPTLEDIRDELEKDGWYCFIGDLNPFNKIQDIKKQIPERHGFTSLSIMDIENGIAQYVYVFLEEDRVRIAGDLFDVDKGSELTLSQVRQEWVDVAIRKIINNQ
jgi:hypothetical protein